MERLQIDCGNLKFDDTASKGGEFSGYGAYFGNVDVYDDVIAKGAFKASLSEWKAKGKLPPMLLQHGGGMFGGDPDGLLPVGQWTDMRENSKGLRVEGKLFAMNTERGQYIYEGMKAGVLDGLSIGFLTKQQKYGTKPGEPSRTLIEVDLKEISIVTFPANDLARVSNVKRLMLDQIRDFEEALRDAGLSRRDSAKAISVLKSFQRDAELPDSMLRDAVAPGESENCGDACTAALAVEAKICASLLRF